MLQRISVLTLVVVLLAACGTTPPPNVVTPAPQSTGATGQATPAANYPGPGATSQPSATPGALQPATPPGGMPPYPVGTGTIAPMTPTPTAASPAAAIPANCSPASGQAAYFDIANGYCLQYPGGFTVRDQRPGPLGIFGPALDPSVEPVQASLTINVDPANGKTLKEIVDPIVVEASAVPVTRTATTLGGEPAEMLAGMPGRTMNQQVIVIHEDRAYRLILYPVDPGFPQAQPDIEKLWAAVSKSFTFLPAEFGAAYSSCPKGTETAAPYLDPYSGFCLLYPPSVSVAVTGAVTPTLVTSLSGPAHEPGAEPIRATLVISTGQATAGRSLDQVVADYLATFPVGTASAITRTQATIGGQPAIVLDGVPARLPAREAFVIDQGRVYEFTLQPFRDPALQGFQQEVDQLWEEVTTSFTFVSRP